MELTEYNTAYTNWKLLVREGNFAIFYGNRISKATNNLVERWQVIEIKVLTSPKIAYKTENNQMVRYYQPVGTERRAKKFWSFLTYNDAYSKLIELAMENQKL